MGRARKDRRVVADQVVQEVRLAVLGDILGDLEETVRATALGVNDSLGHTLSVELRHLLDQIVVLEQNRAVGSDCERVLVAGRGNASIGRGPGSLLIAHSGCSFRWVARARGQAYRVTAPLSGNHSLPIGYQMSMGSNRPVSTV